MSAPLPEDFSYQQLTIKAGECFNLPADAELIYASDVTNLTSECDIPTSFDLTCYGLAYENPVDPPLNDSAFIGVTIDGVYYAFSATINYSYDNSANDLMAQMAIDVPPGIFIFGGTCDIGGSNQFLFFQSVGSNIVFKVQNPTGSDVTNQFVYFIPEVITPCDCTGASS